MPVENATTFSKRVARMVTWKRGHRAARYRTAANSVSPAVVDVGNFLRFGAAGIAALGAAWYLTPKSDAKTEAKFRLFSAAGPLIRLLDAETAHKIAIWSFSAGLYPREDMPENKALAVRLWGRDFPNPLGLAAGFDKDAEAIDATLGMGFGFVEVGTVTPLPQPGNPKPRMFRLTELGAVINRYGFNSKGADYAAQQLARYRESTRAGTSGPRGLLAVNVGKNKTTEDAASDYCTGVQRLGPYADMIVVNISSPNTPGLRALQGRKELEALVRRVKAARDAMSWGESGPPPLVVKIAPDLTEDDKKDIAAVVAQTAIDGLVVSNTTIERPGPVAEHPNGGETGGLSGRPLMEMSTAALADMYRLTDGKVPLIGAGGISDGYDAYRKIRAGASLVEVYTMFAYDGPTMVRKVKRELAECLARDGFSSVQEAVGVDHRKKH